MGRDPRHSSEPERRAAGTTLTKHVEAREVTNSKTWRVGESAQRCESALTRQALTHMCATAAKDTAEIHHCISVQRKSIETDSSIGLSPKRKP